MTPNRPWDDVPHKERSALQEFIDTVDCTGGVFRSEEHGGCLCPEGSPDWPDLGETYLKACAELGVEPYVQEE